MRLSDYIRDNIEVIMQEWEEFAATLVPPAQKMDKVLLRDHLKQMLTVISADIEQHQSAHEEGKKSKGHADLSPVEETAASIHGVERLAIGFSLNAAIAEYRALRASVTRLWQTSLEGKPLPSTAMQDLIRFNEAIDQAINESVTSYGVEKEQQTRMFDAILSSMPDLCFTLDLSGTFTYANRAFVDLLDRPLDQIVGKKCLDLQIPGTKELHHHIQEVMTTKKQFRGEMLYTQPSGQLEFYDYILVPTFDNNGVTEAVAGTARNITERKAAEDENWHKANYDLLTGLPNRRLFLDRLMQDVKHAERGNNQLALLFIDLDRFKEANDSFGHDAGDLLLRRVADRLRAYVRETDTVARLGGDEFVVILKNVGNAEHIKRVTEKILKGLSTPFEIYTHHIDISSSIGVAIYPQDASIPDDLIKYADQAMYTAKSAGRNRISFFLPN